MKIYYENLSNIHEVYELWQQAFMDSDSFAAYYFKEKCKDNRLLTAYEEEKLVSMLFLNPYTMKLAEDILASYYIVGVATHKDYRKRGYMRKLLEKSLRDMAAEGVPFTFLMPANTAYYTPFQFSLLYETTLVQYEPLGAEEAACEYKKITLEPLEGNFDKRLAQNIEAIVDKLSNLHCIRSEAYIKRLMKEAKSEGGELVLFRKGGTIVGYFVYTLAQKKSSISQLIADFAIEEAIALVRSYLSSYSTAFVLPNYLVKGSMTGAAMEADKGIMFRALRPDKLLAMLRCQDKKELTISIIDPIITSNNKTYQWIIDPDLSELKETNKQPSEILTIEEVNKLVFGGGLLQGSKLFFKANSHKNTLINETV